MNISSPIRAFTLSVLLMFVLGTSFAAPMRVFASEEGGEAPVSESSEPTPSESTEGTAGGEESPVEIPAEPETSEEPSVSEESVPEEEVIVEPITEELSEEGGEDSVIEEFVEVEEESISEEPLLALFSLPEEILEEEPVEEEPVDLCTLPNILGNGSFEDVDGRLGSVHSIALNILGTSSPHWDLFQTLPWVDVPEADSWYTESGTGIEVEYSGVVTPSQDGVHHVELDSHGEASTNSSMSQDVMLPVGSYDLSFWYQPRTNTEGDNTINVYWDGVLLTTLDGTGPADWQNVLLELSVETEGVYTLTFEAAGIENSLGGLLDNVVLTCGEGEGGGGGEEDPEEIFPSITINKVVINDDEGRANSEDFSFILTPEGEGRTYSVSQGIPSTVAPGVYVISEVGPEGYVASFSETCEGGMFTAEMDGVYTCTVTNDDSDSEEESEEESGGGSGGGGGGSTPVTGTLIVDLMVVNDDGGTYEEEDFTITVDGRVIEPNTLYAFLPGTYTVTTEANPEEDLVSAFANFQIFAAATTTYATSYAINCGANGSVVINSGSTATCEITVDDVPLLAPVPQVLGVSDVDDEGSVSAPVPQVLGAVDELPRTGGASPVIPVVLFSLFFTGMALRSHEKRA